MKLIYQIILGVLLATCSISAYAGGIMMMGGGVPVSGPSYLLSENFTTGSAPSGWTAASAYIRYNYDAGDTYPLEGSYSFVLDTVGTGGLYVTSASFSAASGDVYVAYRYAQSTAANGDNTYVNLRDASNNTLCAIQHGVDDQLDGINTGGSQVSNFITITRDSPIYVKLHYVKGAGTATVTYYTSSDGSTWTTEGTSSNGTSNADAAHIQFTASSNANQNNQLVFDQIRVSNSDINY